MMLRKYAKTRKMKFYLIWHIYVTRCDGMCSLKAET